MTAPFPSTSTPHVLRRSRHDRVIAGGSGILIYIVAIIVIPEEKPGEDLGPVHARSGATGRILVGTALIALGTILLVDRFVSWFDKIVGPLTLVALGVAVLVWGTRR